MTNSAMADGVVTIVTDSAVFLPKGGIAPFTGYEISPQKAESIRDDSIDLDTAKKVNSNLTEENALLSQRLANSQSQDDYLSKQLVSERDNSFLGKLGMFALGAAAASLVAFGAARAVR